MKKLYDILIDAGTDGITQNQIVKKLQGSYSGGIILTVLEDWREQGAVQKFEVQKTTRPATYWRATKKILETDMQIRNAIKDFYGGILQETDDAILFEFDNDEEPVWLPKSKIEIDASGEVDCVSVPKWLAENRGMIK